MSLFGIIIFIILFLFLVELYIDNNTIGITNYTVRDKKIKEEFNGYKILQLSDLHSKSFGKDNYRLIKKIDDINPDIIVMTGDMLNGNDDNFDAFFNLSKTLKEKYKVFYIKGNHEETLSIENQKKIFDFLTSNDIKVLDNEKVIINKGNDSISLWGMWCELCYYNTKYGEMKVFTDETMRTIMKKDDIDLNEFNILLAHNPNFIPAFVSWGADLVLSGHIHGGMVRLPFVGGIFSPDTRLFPKYSEGMYIVSNKILIVNRGLASGVRGFRLFNRPEIGVITLMS